MVSVAKPLLWSGWMLVDLEWNQINYQHELPLNLSWTYVSSDVMP